MSTVKVIATKGGERRSMLCESEAQANAVVFTLQQGGIQAGIDGASDPFDLFRNIFNGKAAQ